MANLSNRPILLGSCLVLLSPFPVAMAQEAEQGCRLSQVQPEDIDLDQPGRQIARSSDLDIPDNARIREIHVMTRPIFDTDDPEENNVLYRLANWLNPTIWPSALRSQLVIEEGDPYRPGEVSESERILRDKPYVSAAWVAPVRVCGDQVDVVVLTRDTWTRSVNVGVSRSGGENTFELGVSDPNFFGTGKSFAISHTNDPDRSTTSVNYRDPNIWGSRWQADLSVAERSDGNGARIAIERPFFSENAQWAFGVEAADDEREEDLFFGGDEVSTFERDRRQFGVFYGTALATGGVTQTRLLAGYRFDEQRFEPVDGELAPDPFPDDRTRSYPWVFVTVLISVRNWASQARPWAEPRTGSFWRTVSVTLFWLPRTSLPITRSPRVVII